MKKIERSQQHYVIVFEGEEKQILESLINEFCQLIAPLQPGQPQPLANQNPLEGASASADPFSVWESEFHQESQELAALADPAFDRIFPNPCPEDSAVAAEFNQYTLSEQVKRKLQTSQVVLADLASDSQTCLVALDHFDAWLKTINQLRLIISTRLAVASSEDVERLDQLCQTGQAPFQVMVYQWLGFVLESLIEAANPQFY